MLTTHLCSAADTCEIPTHLPQLTNYSFHCRFARGRPLLDRKRSREVLREHHGLQGLRRDVQRAGGRRDGPASPDPRVPRQVSGNKAGTSAEDNGTRGRTAKVVRLACTHAEKESPMLLHYRLQFFAELYPLPYSSPHISTFYKNWSHAEHNTVFISTFALFLYYYSYIPSSLFFVITHILHT